MKTGCLWFDDSKIQLAEKIRKAATFYQAKYGQAPTLAHVHPDMAKPEISLPGITIIADCYVQKNHIWIGVQQSV